MKTRRIAWQRTRARERDASRCHADAGTARKGVSIVPLPPPETQAFVDQIGMMEGQTRQEMEQSQQQLQEIRLLLGQTASEVEKLSQREITLANRVRDME